MTRRYFEARPLQRGPHSSSQWKRPGKKDATDRQLRRRAFHVALMCCADSVPRRALGNQRSRPAPTCQSTVSRLTYTLTSWAFTTGAAGREVSAGAVCLSLGYAAWPISAFGFVRTFPRGKSCARPAARSPSGGRDRTSMIYFGEPRSNAGCSNWTSGSPESDCYHAGWDRRPNLAAAGMSAAHYARTARSTTAAVAADARWHRTGRRNGGKTQVSRSRR